MQTNQERTFESLHAIQAFIDTHAPAFPAVADSGAKRELDAIIGHLSYHVSTQSGSNLGSRLKTQEQQALRIALFKDHIRPIIASARLSPGTFPPGVFRVPKLNAAPAKLAKAAHEMARAAEPRAEEFIGMGLPADFISQLLAAAQAVLDAVGARTELRGARVGSTSSLRATLTSARRLVNLLDALIRKEITGNPALLANWNFIRRLDGGAMPPSDSLLLSAGVPSRLLATNVRYLPPTPPQDEPLEILPA